MNANRRRFHQPPFNANMDRNCIDLQFSGVTQHITCSIGSDGSTGIWVHYAGQCWDSLAEFDVAPEKASQGGYFCRFCITPQFFASRQALLIEHSWQPLLEWVNEKLLRPLGSACTEERTSGSQ